MLVEILPFIVTIIVCFISYELATIKPLGCHSPHLVDDIDTLYLGDQHRQKAVFVFLDFYFIVFISLPMCQSTSVSVDLIAIHL